MTSFSCEGVVVRFRRRRALERVSVEGGVGATVLLGPNGAGKTTLLKVLLGEIRPDAGRATVDGLDPSRRRRRVMSQLGWMPQQPMLPQRMALEDFATYAAWLKGSSWRAARQSAAAVLEQVHLVDRRRDVLGALSGGMQRRAAFAAAIIHAPHVLLLDEPLEGLDPEERSDLLDLIRGYAADHCVILSTHILQDLPRVADEVVVLARGSVQQRGPFSAFAATVDSAGLEAAYRRAMSKVDSP